MPTEQSLAADYRAAEARLLASYGLTATERAVDAGRVGAPAPYRDPGAVRLHAIDIPGDPARPPVVLLHGIASVTAAAIPLIPAFDGRRVIALDWPGHGLSSAGTLRVDGIRTQPVQWIQAVVEAFGLDTFELVGHSLGGQFALYYALSHPQRVLSLTLLGIPGAALPGLKAPGAMRLMLLPGLARWFLSRPVTREQYEANSAITLGPGAVQPWPRELVDVGWYASQRQAFVDSLPSYYRALTSAFGVRRSAVLSPTELASLPMPVLALLGENDVFLSVDAAAPALAAIPNATLRRVEGGHAPWLNSPEASADAVRAFLSQG